MPLAGGNHMSVPAVADRADAAEEELIGDKTQIKYRHCVAS
jgi:hypothetical protein